MPPRERREHSGRDVKVQRGMLDIKQRSGGLDGRSGPDAVCVGDGLNEEPSSPLSRLPFTAFYLIRKHLSC